MKQYPVVSIVIPTYNSDRVLEKVLKSIKKQNYPKNRLEVLLVDGGSVDSSTKIGKKYGALIINNKETNMVHGKNLGFKLARGKYVMFLDADEVLESKESIKLKVDVFLKENNVKAVIPTGYKTDESSPIVNRYVNEYGDPFSYFIYGESKDPKYFICELEHKYREIINNNRYVAFNFSKFNSLPLIELWAGGCMVEKKYILDTIPELKHNESLLPLIFYYFKHDSAHVAITRNDSVVHYSCTSLRNYLKKLRSRVEFSVFRTNMGKAGFSGREELNPTLLRKVKKYTFILYSFSLILPFFDSIRLFIKTKQKIYLLHWYLCLFISFYILYFILIKVISNRHVIRNYAQ